MLFCPTRLDVVKVDDYDITHDYQLLAQYSDEFRF